MFVIKIAVLTIALIALGVEGKAVRVPQPRDIFDTAQALIDDLRQSVFQAQTSAISTLNLLVNQVNALANSKLVETRTALHYARVELDTEIQGIRSDVEESGGDVELLDTCIADFTNDLDNMETFITSEVTVCVNVSNQQALGIIQRNEEQIQLFTNVVDRLDLSLAQCRLLSEEQGTQCALQVITATSVELIDLPAQIDQDVEQTRAVCNALTASYDPCLTDRIPSITIVGEQIIGLIKECANLTESKKISIKYA